MFPPQIKTHSLRRWLHDLSFKFTEYKKKFYFDRHKQEDIVIDRLRFNQQMLEAKTKTDKINQISLEEIRVQGLTHVRVTQDKKIHHSNNIQTRYLNSLVYTYHNKKPATSTPERKMRERREEEEASVIFGCLGPDIYNTHAVPESQFWSLGLVPDSNFWLSGTRYI